MKQSKPIMPRLKVMEISDSIAFPYQQRQSVEVTRARAQRIHKMKFKIETIDQEMNFKVIRTA